MIGGVLLFFLLIFVFCFCFFRVSFVKCICFLNFLLLVFFCCKFVDIVLICCVLVLYCLVWVLVIYFWVLVCVLVVCVCSVWVVVCFLVRDSCVCCCVICCCIWVICCCFFVGCCDWCNLVIIFLCLDRFMFLMIDLISIGYIGLLVGIVCKSCISCVILYLWVMMFREDVVWNLKFCVGYNLGLYCI